MANAVRIENKPCKYNVLEQIVLNCTNIDGNNNKFYVMELHELDDKYRIFIHHGRVGDPGVKLGKDYPKTSKEEAEKEYQKILKEKQKKGYVAVELESSEAKTKKTAPTKCDLDLRVQKFVEQIYEEASRSLSNTIRTPLGALSESQIEKGRQKLEQIRKAIQYQHNRRPNGSTNLCAAISPAIFRISIYIYRIIKSDII